MVQTFIPAATLVLMRDTPTGDPPDLLMIERAASMTFAGGALVFPGGRIDPGDHAVAANEALIGTGFDLEDAAARIGAIRETIEEVGIAVGVNPTPDDAATAQLRAALSKGGDFGALLAAGGYRLNLRALTFFAHWRPNLNETRNFDTRFYLAEPPANAAAAPDGGESVKALWMSAARLLADADAGHHQIIFPTRRNLERLARFAVLEEAIADAAGRAIVTITPWIEERDGDNWLCIPDDQGYPTTSELLAMVRRR
jgi:8-oxo-dGTP pyrophosphatase MutT (NUDIX family)